ncbi:hypothetical protein [Escherichia coli]|uniref:hypothetical protein n=1 Tax=Escherichia coli TaxID=562 RepID=UPI0002CC560E|nr:hypothetical protein [Escherichia coli]ENA50539.1 hypothetical protein EC2726950_3350 [Escherichia coli 2726950]ENB20017.1 hypothetical protein ECBCE011MS01_3191 [Escherichia coli BCE011_MS-01]HBA6240055.1 antirestriction protein [Escherichia coli]HBA6519861.1 antirestriction protein [Escherichia coli]HBA6623006.1 antirestriction protein [Escherichia coli]
MQHVPEGVIQAPESPDAPEALPGCRSISDDDLCTWCTRLLYRPGELSLCRLSTGNGIFWPSVCDRNGYAYGCPEFQPNIIHP